MVRISKCLYLSITMYYTAKAKQGTSMSKDSSLLDRAALAHCEGLGASGVLLLPLFCPHVFN